MAKKLSFPSQSTFEFQQTKIGGCFTFKSRLFKDSRGSFRKVFSSATLKSIGLEMPVAEVFISDSQKGVIRGMHFQTPPYDLIKVVSCISGRVLDVILDLRVDSPTFGQSVGIELSAGNQETVVVPSYCAHGFYAYEDNSSMCYIVDQGHNPDADHGILWNSFGFAWPKEVNDVILSPRDLQFQKFHAFQSPFHEQ